MSDIVERLNAALAEIQDRDRPLPWVVHSGCSYRRIASVPTRENDFRSFPDGNVLHAYKQRSDGHPDLSMGEDQLTALVDIVNATPEAAAEITRLRADLKDAVFQCADWAGKYGEAKGLLEGSEAAGAVDMWRDECERLRTALKRIAGMLDGEQAWFARDIARQALGDRG